MQVFDEEFADEFDFDVLDATKIIPEEQVPVRSVGRLVLDRVRRQLLRRDRAGRLLHAERRAGHRLHQRPAAAGPQLLLPRHPAQAARQAQLHADPDQRAAAARSRTSSATGTCRSSRPGGARQLRAQHAGGDERGPRDDADNGLHAPCRGRGGRRRRGASGRRPSPTTTARRGSSTISQTDGRAGAHRRGVRLRARQGASCRRSARAWSRNLRNVDEDLAQAVADELGMPLPEADAGGRRAAHRPARVARAQHPAQRPGLASPAASSASS